MTKDIKAAGGKVTTTVTKSTDFLIATEAEVSSLTSKVRHTARPHPPRGLTRHARANASAGHVHQRTCVKGGCMAQLTA